MPQIPAILDDHHIEFPDADLALPEPNGLLAIGGDLSPERLLNAYQHGIFPWYSDGQPILWWSPDPRAVIFPDRIKISRSLAKIIKQNLFTITEDKAFSNVIHACSEPRIEQNGTWITDEMLGAYTKLHQWGHAHSIEVWQDKKLIGGLYGIDLGQNYRIFCGESMFSRVNNSSKVALVYLAKKLAKLNYQLIDCQIPNDHLSRMGAINISRREFLRFLSF